MSDAEHDLHPRAAADQAWVDERERIERAADQRRFRPIPFKDITLNTSRPYLVKGLIPREALTVIWGPPKCGKTFWALDIAMHVALGRRYRDRRVHQGAVLYIAAEGERGLNARIEAFRQEKLQQDNHNPPFYLLSTRLQLVTDVAQLIRDVRVTLGETECALIVIDTLNRTITGSESSDADMTDYIDAADKLRGEFNASVAIIHHCGISGDRPRGHTSLGGAIDAQIAVKKHPLGIKTIVEFMKDGPEGETTLSHLVPVQVGIDEDDEPITSLVVEEINSEQPQYERKKGQPKPHLTPKQQIAFDLLGKALSAHGEPAPANNYIPPNATVTQIDLWRRFYLAGTAADGQSDDTRRKALREAREALHSKKLIGIFNELVWIV